MAAALRKPGGAAETSTALPPADTSLTDLLAYYRSKIVAFEVEREAWLEKLTDAERHDAELTRLQWDDRARCDDELAARRAARDAELQLQEERKTVMLLRAENTELRAREAADRKTIHDLLAMGPPPPSSVASGASSAPSGTPGGAADMVRARVTACARVCVYACVCARMCACHCGAKPGGLRSRG